MHRSFAATLRALAGFAAVSALSVPVLADGPGRGSRGGGHDHGRGGGQWNQRSYGGGHSGHGHSGRGYSGSRSSFSLSIGVGSYGSYGSYGSGWCGTPVYRAPAYCPPPVRYYSRPVYTAPVCVTPAPVYVAPAPVYVPPPVYVAPSPVYIAPRTVCVTSTPVVVQGTAIASTVTTVSQPAPVVQTIAQTIPQPAPITVGDVGATMVASAAPAVFSSSVSTSDSISNLSLSAFRSGDTVIVAVSGVGPASASIASLDSRDGSPSLQLQTAAGAASSSFKTSASIRAARSVTSIPMWIGNQLYQVPITDATPIS